MIKNMSRLALILASFLGLAVLAQVKCFAMLKVWMRCAKAFRAHLLVATAGSAKRQL